MLKKLFTAVFIFGFLFSFSQEDQKIGKVIDELTFAWDLESSNLDKYDGFKRFCVDATYRDEIITMLKDIHHYDSVLYTRLVKAQRFNKSKEVKKTLADIEKFEEEYDMRSFLVFLNDECIGLNEIERNKDDLQDEIGQESYDGRKYILITETGKYIHHITKRVDLLREHVHHLHIE